MAADRDLVVKSVCVLKFSASAKLSSSPLPVEDDSGLYYVASRMRSSKDE